MISSKRVISLFLFFLVLNFTCISLFQAPVEAIDVETLGDKIRERAVNAINPLSTINTSHTNNTNLSTQNRVISPIRVDKKNQKLEDLVERTDIPYGFPTMIPLSGIRISGLGPKAMQCLGENYFVVRTATSYMKMSEVYKDNKSNAKANYVTADCLLHPYLAYVNRVYAETAKKYLLPLTRSLLFAMVKVAVSDYKQADDKDVRSDIEYNIAFLSLGLKLIDPNFNVPPFGKIPQLVSSDYDLILSGKPSKSSIFERFEDFSVYKPTSWYKSSPELATFYRVKTWISRLSYPINDISFENNGVQSNNFRRSVLLYRSLDLAQVEGKPAMEAWTKLVKGLFLLGTHVENWQEKYLFPHDYKSVFKTNSQDLHMTLSALSEPLYRTKLLIAVRRQKPLNLGTASILEMSDTISKEGVVPLFKLVPYVGSPDEPWLRYAATLYPKPSIATNLFPVALMDLNANGAPQAANFLLDSSWAMDENVTKAIAELKHWTLKRAINGQVQAIETRIWSLLSPLWVLLPDGIQTALRGEMWANRRLETAFCAYLDSQNAIAPMPSNSNSKPNSSHETGVKHQLKPISSISTYESVKVASNGKNISIGQTGQVVQKSLNSNARSNARNSTGKLSRQEIARRTSRCHFLDPYPELYSKMSTDSQHIIQTLGTLGFALEPILLKGLEDYQRLFQRLNKIAKDELELKPLAVQDLNLLGNIDMILEKIDLPLPALKHYRPLASTKKNDDPNVELENESSGFTMAIGRPGLLYIILQNKATQEWTLARGAVYVYYEEYGNSLTEENLLSKIDHGQISVPYWTERFDFTLNELKK